LFELAGVNWKNTIHFYVFLCDGSCAILSAVSAYLLGDARRILFIQAILCVVMILMMVRLPESPKFLLQKK